MQFKYPFIGILIFVLFLMSGCVNHPSYWSEESCDYCMKQNEHYIRVHKDEMVNRKLNILAREVRSLKEKEVK